MLEPKSWEPVLLATENPLLVKLFKPLDADVVLLPFPSFVFAVLLELVKPAFVPKVTDVLAKLSLPALKVPAFEPGPLSDAA